MHLSTHIVSHPGRKAGDENADKETKEAVKDDTAVDLKLSLAEIKSITHRTACKVHEETKKQRCETHGWFFLAGRDKRDNYSGQGETWKL